MLIVPIIFFAVVLVLLLVSAEVIAPFPPVWSRLIRFAAFVLALILIVLFLVR